MQITKIILLWIVTDLQEGKLFHLFHSNCIITIFPLEIQSVIGDCLRLYHRHRKVGLYLRRKELILMHFLTDICDVLIVYKTLTLTFWLSCLVIKITQCVCIVDYAMFGNCLCIFMVKYIFIYLRVIICDLQTVASSYCFTIYTSADWMFTNALCSSLIHIIGFGFLKVH